MSDDLIKRLRVVTGFIRFETEDRIAASACLSEEAAARIEELEAKLAKAVEALKIISGKSMDECGRYYTNRSSIRTARNTLAELKRETE